MSFNVFAAGAGRFHYQREGCIDGDSFTPMRVVNALMSMEPTAVGAADAYIGYNTPDVTDLMESLATQEFLHLLNLSVCSLAMCTGASDGGISVASTESHILWPDTKAFAKYNFQPGDNPGAEFIQLIGPGLRETGLNNWGVLRALSIVLSLYSDHIGDHARPLINISLDH